MKIYIVTSDKGNYFETFKNLKEVVDKIDKLNKDQFNGKPFFLSGQNFDYFTNKEKPYLIDHAILTTKGNEIDKPEIYVFTIRAIDQKGNRTEL
jgi:lipopolysaccharide export system protein LptA